jgi:hypothetical protein
MFTHTEHEVLRTRVCIKVNEPSTMDDLDLPN